MEWVMNRAHRYDRWKVVGVDGIDSPRYPPPDYSESVESFERLGLPSSSETHSSAVEEVRRKVFDSRQPQLKS